MDVTIDSSKAYTTGISSLRRLSLSTQTSAVTAVTNATATTEKSKGKTDLRNEKIMRAAENMKSSRNTNKLDSNESVDPVKYNANKTNATRRGSYSQSPRRNIVSNVQSLGTGNPIATNELKGINDLSQGPAKDKSFLDIISKKIFVDDTRSIAASKSQQKSSRKSSLNSPTSSKRNSDTIASTSLSPSKKSATVKTAEVIHIPRPRFDVDDDKSINLDQGIDDSIDLDEDGRQNPSKHKKSVKDRNHIESNTQSKLTMVQFLIDAVTEKKI